MHKLFMDYGRLLDASDSEGIFLRAPHFGNVKRHVVQGEARLFHKDFSVALDFKGQPAERQVGYRVLSIAMATCHLPQLPPFDDIDRQMRLMNMLAFNPYTSLLIGYFHDRPGDMRIYGCHPCNYLKILDPANAAPLHRMNLPEVGLAWDKVRRIAVPDPNVPPCAVFYAPDGLRIEQRLPDGVCAREFEARVWELAAHGVTWISVSTLPAEASYTIHRSEFSLQLRVPGGLSPRLCGRAVLALMDTALLELARGARAGRRQDALPEGPAR